MDNKKYSKPKQKSTTTPNVDPQTTKTRWITLPDVILSVCMCCYVTRINLWACVYVLRAYASLAPHLRLTCSSLDNEVISPPKDITTHLNPHLIHTNTNTCTSGSLVALKVSIRNKKAEKMSAICLTCVSLDNDLISPPKHSTTHLNPHLVYTDTHTCTSGSLVTPKGPIRNKTKKRKSQCFAAFVCYVLRLLVCFEFICLVCI